MSPAAWWQALSQRDRRALQALAVVAVLLLGYLFNVQLEARDEARRRAEAADQSLAWMRQAAAQLVGRAPLQRAAPDGRSLLARVDAGAREAGLGGVLLRVEPVTPTQVRVYFQAAPFDMLMDWLQALGESHGVQVDELSVQRAAGAGLVDARLNLSEPR